MSGGSGGIGGLPPVGASTCQPDDADCAISHATTGWCLQATGAPVIVVTRWACDPNDAAPTVTMLDPSTGNVIPNQVVVPCDSRDFELNHLCDFDPNTGDVIAAVTQIFEWDEATGSLQVRLVLADDPTGPPYVVQGVLRQCHVPTWVDVETSIVCGNTGGILRQLTQMIVWDTRNGLLLSAFYLDAEGNVTPENPGEVFTVGDCYTPTLPTILDELEEVNGHLADVNTELDAQTFLLAQIEENTDGVEGLLTIGNANTSTVANAVHGEDTPVADGDTGIPALARRNDTAAVTTSTDGDYTHISTDAAGRVGITDLGGSVTVDDGGASITVDGVVAVSNFPASVEISNDVGNPIPVTGTVTVTDGAGPLTVDGTVAVSSVIPGTGNTNLGKAEDAAHVTGSTGVMALGVRNDAAAVLTSADGDYSPFATDSAGRVGITTLGGTLGVTDAALATTNAQLALIAGYTDGIEGLLTATNGFLQTLTFTIYQEDSPHVSTNPGTFVLGVRNDTDAVRTSADGDYSPISVDSVGRVKVVSPDLAAINSNTDGLESLLTDILAALGGTGISVYRNISVNATGQVIKGSSGRVMTIHAANLDGNDRFLKLYNKATAPNSGDTPVMTIALEGPANGNTVTLAFDNGVLFNLGIGVRATTGIADADVGNPGANQVIVTIGYQ